MSAEMESMLEILQDAREYLSDLTASETDMQKLRLYFQIFWLLNAACDYLQTYLRLYGARKTLVGKELVT